LAEGLVLRINLGRELLPKLAFSLYDFALTVISWDAIFRVEYSGAHERLGDFHESASDGPVLYLIGKISITRLIN
jgi:hypothetical protein